MRRTATMSGAASPPQQESKMFTLQTLVGGIALVVAGIVILKPRRTKPSPNPERKD
jgi:hypothetical protein